MKRIHTYTFYMLILLIISIACTKEISDDLIKTFSIEFTETTISSFLNTPKSTEFRIKGVESVEAGKYQFKYTVVEGAGFLTINSQEIEPNDFVDLPEESSFTIEYTGTAVNSNRITITVKDIFNNEEQVTLTYDVKDTAFDLEVMSVPSSGYIGGTIDLNFEINNQINPADYAISYKFINPDESGLGVIYKEEEVLNQEEFVAIDEDGDGKFVLQLEGTAVGALTIEFIMESSLNAIVEKTIVVPITETPTFTFTAAPQVVISEINTSVDINFELTETVGSSSYSMEYRASNQGSFIYNEVEYQPGDEIPVMIGTSSGKYTGIAEGDHTLEFITINANTTPISIVSIVGITFKIPDTVAPVIDLNGPEEVTVRVFDTYIDPVIVTDNVDQDLINDIVFGGDYVGTNVLGKFTRTYNVKDLSGNSADEVTRTINVIDDIAPTIELIGGSNISVQIGNSYTDEGVEVSDNYDAVADIKIEISDNINITTFGFYTITYVATDSSGNRSEMTRSVTVFNKPVARFSPRDITGTAPFLVDFNAAGSESDGIIIDVKWNFGDGSPVESHDVFDNVNHTFSAKGIYTVTIEILDEYGGRDTASTKVTAN